MKQPSLLRLWSLVFALGIIALACSFPGLGNRETPDIETGATPEIVLGGTATPSPLAEGSETPTPLATPSATATAEPCTFRASYVADVTIPDDTQVEAGAEFEKTWRIRNSGTCPWDAGTQLVSVSEETMSTLSAVTVPLAAPNAEVEVSVRMRAPTAAGTHRSDWQLTAPDGKRFGGIFYAQIVVSGTGVTPSPTPLAQTSSPPRSFFGSAAADCKRVNLTWIGGQGHSAYRVQGPGLDVKLAADAGAYAWDNPPTGLSIATLTALDKDDKETARLSTTVGVHCGSEQPDLVAASVTFVPATPVAHMPVTATVRVKNEGSAGSGTFVVRWWAIKTAPEPTCEWVVNEGLGAGKSVDLTCKAPAYTSVYASLLTAVHVDATGIIQEKEKQNNRLEPDIQVIAPAVVFDFVTQADTAAWTSGPPTAPLAWPGNAADAAGYARWTGDPLETGSTPQGFCLEMHPKKVAEGTIRGEYQRIGTTAYVIRPGDHFRATVSMLQGATQGAINYRVMLVLSQSGSQWIATESHTYGAGIEVISVDLTPYAGQSATAVLQVEAGSSAADDRACWIEARIFRYP